ncbi:MAG: VOC family protein [Minwuia sp.]|uniref:VOC family protein n=1 Tax=Minwuia sp. TaxID=2493630 RepID=UPI003A8C43A0
MLDTSQVFHININCSDLERSLEFYRLLGFREVINFNATGEGTADTDVLGDPVLGPALGLPASSQARARMLMLGDNPRSARLDLIQWIEPKAEGRSYPHLAHIGIARICFRVGNVEDAWRQLEDAGAEPFTEPVLIEMGGSRQKFFCAKDPDGVVVEFMEFLKD